MAGFHRFSPVSYTDYREPPPAREQERSHSPWFQTPGTESEDEAPWLHPSCSPTLRSRRRGYTAPPPPPPPPPRESHSLTHVARRTPVPARSGRRYPEDAWMEARTRLSPAWQQQPPLQPQPCQGARPSQGGSLPLFPGGANSATGVGPLWLDEAHTGDQWAVPVCRHEGLSSPASALADKSWARPQKYRPHCVCAQKRDSGDLLDSFAGQYSQPSAFRSEAQSQHAQGLGSKLEEAMVSSRDQKIVALVLTRLKKAQRMRELQQQAAVAWEELERWDHKVQLTLERERRRLLQRSREQWQPRREPRRARPGREPPGDGPAKGAALQPDSGCWRAALDDRLKQGLDGLERRARAQVDHPLQQRQGQRLLERERELQSLRELYRPPPPQQPPQQQQQQPKKQVHAVEDPKAVEEGNLSSLVNIQARKALKDCRAKAKEFLRKLSLEPTFQESQQGPRKERPPRELHAAKPSEQDELETQLRVRKRILLQLAEQETARHLRELSHLREKSQQVLRMKGDREQKSHVEGIQEAVEKEPTVEQISRGNDPPLHEFQKVPRASKRDSGTFVTSCLGPVAAEAQLHHHQPRAGVPRTPDKE